MLSQNHLARAIHLPLAVMIALLGIASASAEDLLPLEDIQPVAEKQLSVEQVSEFAKLYAEYTKAFEAYNESVEEAGEQDPMFREAARRQIEFAQKLAAVRNNFETKARAVVARNPKLDQEFRLWSQLYGSRYNESEMILSLAGDKSIRPFFIWSNHFVFTARPRDEHPEQLRAFLPEDTKTLTPEQALEASLKFARQPATEQLTAQLKELEEKFAGVELPRKEIEELHRTNATNLLYQGYRTVKTPDAVKSAEQQVIQIGNQIIAVWPQFSAEYQKTLESKKKQQG